MPKVDPKEAEMRVDALVGATIDVASAVKRPRAEFDAALTKQAKARAAVLARMDRRAVIEACARVADRIAEGQRGICAEFPYEKDRTVTGEDSYNHAGNTADQIAAAIRALADKETGNG